MASSDRIKAFGYAALGVGFLVNAWDIWTTSAPGPLSSNLKGSGGKRLPAKVVPIRQRAALLGPPRTQEHTVGPIGQRADIIKRMIKKGALSPTVIEARTEILGRKCPDGRGGLKWCVEEKNCLAEVREVFNALRDPNSKFAIRYTRDSIFADVFTSAERTLIKNHLEDCDGYVIAAGALLASAGHDVFLRIVQEIGKPSWSHIYLVTPDRFDDPKATMVAFDASVTNRHFGYEVEGAKETVKSGRPSGRVQAVRDYRVE